MMHIFNFIVRKNLSRLYKMVKDKKRKASFSIDFLHDENKMYRVDCRVNPGDRIEEVEPKVALEVYSSYW